MEFMESRKDVEAMLACSSRLICSIVSVAASTELSCNINAPRKANCLCSSGTDMCMIMRSLEF